MQVKSEIAGSVWKIIAETGADLAADDVGFADSFLFTMMTVWTLASFFNFQTQTLLFL